MFWIVLCGIWLLIVLIMLFIVLLLYNSVVGLCMILMCLIDSGFCGIVWLYDSDDVLQVVMLFCSSWIWLLFILWMIGWLIIGLQVVVDMLGSLLSVLLSELVWWCVSVLLESWMVGVISLVLLSGFVVMKIGVSGVDVLVGVLDVFGVLVCVWVMVVNSISDRDESG